MYEYILLNDAFNLQKSKQLNSKALIVRVSKNITSYGCQSYIVRKTKFSIRPRGFYSGERDGGCTITLKECYPSGFVESFSYRAPTRVSLSSRVAPYNCGWNMDFLFFYNDCSAPKILIFLTKKLCETWSLSNKSSWL